MKNNISLLHLQPISDNYINICDKYRSILEKENEIDRIVSDNNYTFNSFVQMNVFALDSLIQKEKNKIHMYNKKCMSYWKRNYPYMYFTK